MTALNSKVKVYWVDRLFVGPEYQTDVWVSEQARKAIGKLIERKGDSGPRFLQKVKHYAKAGFSKFESKNGPVKHEWKGVYRVAHSSFLFRLIGFYEGDKGGFIGIDAFMKSGRQLKDSERDRINEVVRVRDLGVWRKRDEPCSA